MMREVRILREEKLVIVAKVADSFLTRLRGLLGSPEPREGEGLLIVPCNSIHMFGMKYPLDVLFLSKENEVVAILENIQPWRASRVYGKAQKVLEVRAGTAKKLGIVVGDRLSLEEA